MKQGIFSIYDSKAEAFIQPFFAATVGVAIRNVRRATEEEGSNFKHFAADYTLFELGTFEDTTGEIHLLPAHVNHGTALTLRSLKIAHETVADHQRE